MTEPGAIISRLLQIRNRYGDDYSTEKLSILNALQGKTVKRKNDLKAYAEALLFLVAYPDNKSVYQLARKSLGGLSSFIQRHKKARESLYNSGITGTQICGSFSFEIVKFLRLEYAKGITLDSLEAPDGQILSILSVVMPKVESEILQDANTTWKLWLKKSRRKGEDLLDQLIAIFDQTGIRPEVKDELWTALGIFIIIDLAKETCLPDSLIIPYYHRSILKKHDGKWDDVKPARIKLSENEAKSIIECGRMILVRHIREIDPVTFSAANLVSYYHLSRGISVALMQMVPERRHPIDSYMGYVAFKNGLPVAYAGSWILFDSARIGLNVFPAYRGGESQFIFQQVLKLHSKVYHLDRFSVDPYQIGKENSDGIQSGAFWTYYHAGFRPVREKQKKMAAAEEEKIKSIKGYRSPPSTLRKLADSRLELILRKKPVRFDATDLSIAYAGIVKNKYGGDRKIIEEADFTKLCKMLQIKNPDEKKIAFIVKNWCVLLLQDEQAKARLSIMKKTLKHLFMLKAYGDEEEYLKVLQKSVKLREYFENIFRENEQA